MAFKLDRIKDTDIFYFTNSMIQTVGETLVEGTFNEVLAVASSMKDSAADVGTGGSVAIETALGLTDIIDAKWYVLILNTNMNTLRIQIVRTSGTEKYSLPILDQDQNVLWDPSR